MGVIDLVAGFPRKGKYLVIIAYTKKYMQSDWLRGVQYWLYLYSVFNNFLQVSSIMVFGKYSANLQEKTHAEV